MEGFVIWIARRQQVPLGTGIQNPEDRFQERPASGRVYARVWYRECVLRENGRESVPIGHRAAGACADS